MLVRVTEKFLGALVPEPNGNRPTVSEIWDGYHFKPKGHQMPVRVRFWKEGGDPTPEKIWKLESFHRKGGRRRDGVGSAIDHLELRLYDRTPAALAEAGIEIVYVLDYAHCGQEEDMGFSPRPKEMIRVNGKARKGAIFFREPGQEIQVTTVAIESRIVARIPVRVEAVGAEPVKGAQNTTRFTKYEVENEGMEALYERRQRRNGSGLLEVVENITEGGRGWRYANLRDWEEGELPPDAAVLTTSEGKLVIEDAGGEKLSW